MKAICATCGGDLTIVEEIYDGKDILLPLVSISILPCCNCMSRVASDASREDELEAERAMENDEHQRESAENGGLGR